MAAINGNNGNNVLNGTAEEDTIRGFGGNDTIDSVDRPTTYSQDRSIHDATS